MRGALNLGVEALIAELWRSATRMLHRRSFAHLDTNFVGRIEPSLRPELDPPALQDEDQTQVVHPARDSMCVRPADTFYNQSKPCDYSPGTDIVRAGTRLAIASDYYIMPAYLQLLDGLFADANSVVGDLRVHVGWSLPAVVVMSACLHVWVYQRRINRLKTLLLFSDPMIVRRLTRCE